MSKVYLDYVGDMHVSEYELFVDEGNSTEGMYIADEEDYLEYTKKLKELFELEKKFVYVESDWEAEYRRKENEQVDIINYYMKNYEHIDKLFEKYKDEFFCTNSKEECIRFLKNEDKIIQGFTKDIMEKDND